MAKNCDEEEMEDIRDGIYAIQKRGEGLLHFTETYRSLTKIPPPKMQAQGQRFRSTKRSYSPVHCNNTM